VQAALPQITWYHKIALMEKLKNPEERAWYACATVQHGKAALNPASVAWI
jgi:predicted nuclease of restriction endonuclease-like (RecB) superfamily